MPVQILFEYLLICRTYGMTPTFPGLHSFAAAQPLQSTAREWWPGWGELD